METAPLEGSSQEASGREVESLQPTKELGDSAVVVVHLVAEGL